MKLKFWGTRGSIPTPQPDRMKYGGDTPCVELRTRDGRMIILDAGTGIRRLGLELLKAAPADKNITINGMSLSGLSALRIQGDRDIVKNLTIRSARLNGIEIGDFDRGVGGGNNNTIFRVKLIGGYGGAGVYIKSSASGGTKTARM